MATLKTLCWASLDGKQTCKEVIIPFDKILCIQDHDDGKGETSLISISNNTAIHVDVPLDKMRKIMNEHHKYPDKDIDTHAEFKELIKPKKSK